MAIKRDFELRILDNDLRAFEKAHKAQAKTKIGAISEEMRKFIFDPHISTVRDLMNYHRQVVLIRPISEREYQPAYVYVKGGLVKVYPYAAGGKLLVSFHIAGWTHLADRAPFHLDRLPMFEAFASRDLTPWSLPQYPDTKVLPEDPSISLDTLSNP